MNKETKDKEIKIQEKSVRIYSLCLILLSIAFPLSAFGTGILDRIAFGLVCIGMPLTAYLVLKKSCKLYKFKQS